MPKALCDYSNAQLKKELSRRKKKTEDSIIDNHRKEFVALKREFENLKDEKRNRVVFNNTRIGYNLKWEDGTDPDIYFETATCVAPVNAEKRLITDVLEDRFIDDSWHLLEITEIKKDYDRTRKTYEDFYKKANRFAKKINIDKYDLWDDYLSD